MQRTDTALRYALLPFGKVALDTSQLDLMAGLDTEQTVNLTSDIVDADNYSHDVATTGSSYVGMLWCAHLEQRNRN